MADSTDQMDFSTFYLFASQGEEKEAGGGEEVRNCFLRQELSIFYIYNVIRL